MNRESNSKEIPRNLLDYENDADCLVKFYQRQSTLEESEYVLSTTLYLQAYLSIRGYTDDELELIKMIVFSKIGALEQSKPGDGKCLKDLIGALHRYNYASPFTRNIDGKYVRYKQKFIAAEEWAIKEFLMTKERTWGKGGKGLVSAFLIILTESKIINEHSKDLKTEHITQYFGKRYKIKGSLLDSFKPSKVKEPLKKFKGLQDMLMSIGD